MSCSNIRQIGLIIHLKGFKYQYLPMRFLVFCNPAFLHIYLEATDIPAVWCSQSWRTLILKMPVVFQNKIFKIISEWEHVFTWKSVITVSSSTRLYNICTISHNFILPWSCYAKLRKLLFLDLFVKGRRSVNWDSICIGPDRLAAAQLGFGSRYFQLQVPKCMAYKQEHFLYTW